MLQMLGEDALSPVVGKMLFPDLIGRALPLDNAFVRSLDRSLALEQAWEQDWASAAKGCRLPQIWEHPLADLYAQSDSTQLPALLLNTVRLDDGQRIAQSNLRLALPGVLDLDALSLDIDRLSLSGAVHNSARFPFVSPAGMVKRADGTGWGHLGDGGYYEASGAASLADVLDKLLAQGLINKTDAGLQACVDAACTGGSRGRVVIVLIDNQPTSYPRGWLRSDALGTGFSANRGGFLAEIALPVSGLLNTRPTLAWNSQMRLALLAGSAPQGLIELRLPAYVNQEQPSMNWWLSDATQRLMREALYSPLDRARYLTQRPANRADQALLCNLQTMRSSIGLPSQPNEHLQCP